VADVALLRPLRPMGRVAEVVVAAGTGAGPGGVLARPPQAAAPQPRQPRPRRRRRAQRGRPRWRWRGQLRAPQGHQLPLLRCLYPKRTLTLRCEPGLRAGVCWLRWGLISQARVSTQAFNAKFNKDALKKVRG
jgi:hypothetical protein